MYKPFKKKFHVRRFFYNPPRIAYRWGFVLKRIHNNTMQFLVFCKNTDYTIKDSGVFVFSYKPKNVLKAFSMVKKFMLKYPHYAYTSSCVTWDGNTMKVYNDKDILIITDDMALRSIKQRKVRIT